MKLKKIFSIIKINNIKAIFKYIKQNGFRGLLKTCSNYIKSDTPDITDEYSAWIYNNEPKLNKLEMQKEYKSCLDLKFGIVMQNEDSNLIKSINDQTYSNFEIITKNDIENANNDYIVFIGENIELSPFALYEFVLAIENSDGILYYSDSDFKQENKRLNPLFKPDFAIDTLLCKNYIGNMFAVKTKFLKQYPEILENLNEDIYYDILLRTSEKTDKIYHIPKVLYHELDLTKKINTKSQKETIKQYLTRNNILFKEIKDGMYEGTYKIEYDINDNPKVSLIVPNKDHIEDLDKLIKSVEKSTYENYEMIIVENNSSDNKTFEYYDKINNPKIKVEKYDINCFNYSSIVNFGVKEASGEYIILLNNDIEILTPNWIEQMLMYVQRKDVGICGVKLYFDDKSIQHAGVTIGTRGLAGHRSREVKEEDFEENDYINIVQDLSAVTAACFMVKKSLYNELLGFDEKLAIDFNDVDFCLKVRQKGLLIVYNPYVYGYHYESKSRGQNDSDEKQKRFAKEYELFVKRWSNVIAKGDPYYNKNYRLDTDIRKINYNKII